MGFCQGTYATIWGTTIYEKCTVVELSTSKKNKQTGNYETDFASKFVKFLGQAHKDAVSLKRRDRIKIGNCDVTSKKGKDGKFYTDYLVFDFSIESVASDINSSDSFMTIPDDVVGELPFS